MTIIILLLSVSFIIALSFLVAFIWSLKNGQFDDVEGPSKKIFFKNNHKN